MTTADKHLAVLREMRKHLRRDEVQFQKVRGMWDLARVCKREADALDWLLSETAYGVTDSEVVT